MTLRPRSTVIRLVVALSMALGLLSPAGALPTTLAEVAHIAAMQAEVAEHGHSHDDAGEDEHAPGQGHHLADHSHETPSLHAGVVSAMPTFVRSWNPTAHRFPRVVKGSRLDRPPRPIIVA